MSNNKKELTKVFSVLDRAEDLCITYTLPCPDRSELLHKILCVMEVLDLDAWLSFDDINFMHDVMGILSNVRVARVARVTRVTFANCFFPRCGREL